jgi:diaminopimelate epimerase
LIPFWKVESIGNDFVLIHGDDAQRLAKGELEQFLHDLAIHASSRHFGVGSDGLLVATPAGPAELDLRMFNPDGSEDFCGNGLRCAFAHAVKQGWFAEGHAVANHLGRRIEGTVEADAGEFLVSFTFPPASYRPEDIPLARDAEAFDVPLFELPGRTYSGSVLTTGSAHTILPVERLPQDEEFFAMSPRMEVDPIFPERTSIMWTEAQSPTDLRLRIWERGAGETLGCGTGSTAAAVDHLRRIGHGGEVRVHNPGGTLTISADHWEAPIRVTGTARQIFRGDLLLHSANARDDEGRTSVGKVHVYR